MITNNNPEELPKDLSFTVVRDISRLYTEGDDFNLHITVGEEPNIEIFKAHSVILRARSPYFRAALSTNWAKKEGDIITFQKSNITPNVFKIILKYIYSGEIDLETIIKENNLLELLIASDELNLIELVDYIQDYITSSLSISNNQMMENNEIDNNNNNELDNNNNENNNIMNQWNSMEWFRKNIVQVFNTVSCNGTLFGKLLSHCIKLIIDDPQLLFLSKDFGLLQEEALITIIAKDNLQMKEIEIWENVIRWGISQTNIKDSEPKNWNQEEIQELEKILRKSVQHIRFHQLTCTEYYYKVRKYKKLLPKELRENLKLFFIIPNSISNNNLNSSNSNNNSSKLITILPPRIPKYKLDSTTIDSKRAALISSWIDRKEDPEYYHPKENPYYFKLLLRGSRDGFFVEDFRKRCFNQGATIIIIQTEIQSTATPSASSSSFHGQTRTGQIIIGGYNPKSWSGTNKFSSSTESFIFSLCSDSQSQITTLSRVVAQHFAISDDDSQFIGFGNGDLYIFKNSCQKRDYMYAILDRTKFSMDEIEVFQVVKKED